MITRFLSVRGVVAIALAMIFAVSARGFAASNTVPGNAAGDGAGTVSGYTVSGVTYTLDATDPRNLSKVTFTVTPAGGGSAPTTVKAKLVSSGSSYATCSNTGGTTWECSVSGVTVTSADELRVVASQ